MYCKNCGKQLEDDVNVCDDCGTKQKDDGIQKEVTKTVIMKEIVDNPSHVVGAISCCFPIVGIVLYLLWKDEKPKSASLVCKWTIAGFVLCALFYVLYFVVFLGIGLLLS